MRCDEFQAAVLADTESPATLEHEHTCSRCRAGAPHMRSLRQTITDSDVWEEPSAELRGDVVAAVANESRLRRRRSGRVARWVPAVAALIAGVVGFGAFLLLQDPPDWEVAIDGAGPAPLASGTVAGWNTESGSRMILDVEGLDPAPPGFVYELWLSAGPRHISAGTFVEATSDLELWAGVSRRDYPRVWVTLEPLDGDESLSGQTVLDTGA
jgi:hypothetical protein